jgi:Uma2 family endonuclease
MMAIDVANSLPKTLPITVEQYRLLVDHGEFQDRPGQVELIYGRILEMNPQGPQHADPIEELEAWSHREAGSLFRIRVEKPIEIAGLNSSPEPDIAWVKLQRYAQRHPRPSDVSLLMEVSVSSQSFDRGEKCRLYAEAEIMECWIIDVETQTIEVMTQPSEAAYQNTKVYGRGETVAPICLPTARLEVARLFSGSVM